MYTTYKGMAGITLKNQSSESNSSMGKQLLGFEL